MTTHKIKVPAGHRIRVVRLLAGLSNDDFHLETGINKLRLSNLETLRVKVREDDFESICPVFPELTHWLAYEGAFSISALQASEKKYCRMIAAKIELDMIPDGFDLTEFIQP